MSESSGEVRQRVVQLVALGAAVGVLLALVFALRGPRPSSDEALTPHDSVAAWGAASPERKRQTAEQVLEELNSLGVLGPRTRVSLSDFGGRARLVDEMVAALDAATDRNVTDYVSPSQSMVKTAERAAGRKGWDK